MRHEANKTTFSTQFFLCSQHLQELQVVPQDLGTLRVGDTVLLCLSVQDSANHGLVVSTGSRNLRKFHMFGLLSCFFTFDLSQSVSS